MRNLNDELTDFIGTEYYYKYGNIVLTDGVATACDKFRCFWLADVVASYQPITNEYMQVWECERGKGNKFKVMCTDGNDNILRVQYIEFSDLEGDKITFWLVDGVLMLPAEY